MAKASKRPSTKQYHGRPWTVRTRPYQVRGLGHTMIAAAAKLRKGKAARTILGVAQDIQRNGA